MIKIKDNSYAFDFTLNSVSETTVLESTRKIERKESSRENEKNDDREEGEEKVVISSLLKGNNSLSIIYNDSMLSCKIEYPITKIKIYKNRIYCSSDYLYIYNSRLEPNKLLNIRRQKNKNTEINAPITSFDINNNNAITCSINTTITVWDLVTNHSITQLIAHDNEVYDVNYYDENIFSSIGNDSNNYSLRSFDKRDMQCSTILYEHNNPLLKLQYNNNSIMCFTNNEIIIIDSRLPTTPLTTITNLQNITSCNWYSSQDHIIASDEQMVYLYNLNSSTPTKQWTSNENISNIVVNDLNIGVLCANSLYFLKI